MAYLRTETQLSEAWNNVTISLAAVATERAKKQEFFDPDYVSEEVWLLYVAAKIGDEYVAYITEEEENELIDGISDLFIYGATS